MECSSQYKVFRIEDHDKTAETERSEIRHELCPYTSNMLEAVAT